MRVSYIHIYVNYKILLNEFLIYPKVITTTVVQSRNSENLIQKLFNSNDKY